MDSLRMAIPTYDGMVSRIAGSGFMFDSVQTLSIFADKLFPSCFFHALVRSTTMNMNLNIAIEPLLALVIGILILLVPRFLNYFVAVYLIVVGILGLIHHTPT